MWKGFLKTVALAVSLFSDMGSANATLVTWHTSHVQTTRDSLTLRIGTALQATGAQSIWLCHEGTLRDDTEIGIATEIATEATTSATEKIFHEQLSDNLVTGDRRALRGLSNKLGTSIIERPTRNAGCAQITEKEYNAITTQYANCRSGRPRCDYARSERALLSAVRR
jgi:hypothetical protein